MLESYFTPILLSYVQRYIKNLTASDLSVSLWSGEVSLARLDLRLDVLEQEIKLPFKFLSGHIHELQLTIPWTSIGRDPVIVKINTIEFTVKLLDKIKKNKYNGNSHQKPPQSGTDVIPVTREESSGYIQSVINRVINNIHFSIENFIIKYVEDEFVLSININHVESYAVNNSWEQLSNISECESFLLRRSIDFQGMTVCLDKLNSSGVIDAYQEPVLYKCSYTSRLEIHLDSYHNLKRLEMSTYCKSLDVSLSESQIPMFLRLCQLTMALYYGLDIPISDDDTAFEDLIQDSKAQEDQSQGWAGWAWSYVPALWTEGQSEVKFTGPPTMKIGFYARHLSFNFKQSTQLQQVKASSYLVYLVSMFEGIQLEFHLQGDEHFSMNFGITRCELKPLGNCLCGATNIFEPSIMTSGEYGLAENCIENSLFDSNNDIPTISRLPNFRHEINSVEALRKFPTVYFDYKYVVADASLPVELWQETSIRHLFFGQCKFYVNADAIHRLLTVSTASQSHIYSPYACLEITQLDIETLNLNSMSMRHTNAMITDWSLKISASTHNYWIPGMESNSSEIKSYRYVPTIGVQIPNLEIRMSAPMYDQQVVRFVIANIDDEYIRCCYTQVEVSAYDIGMSVELPGSGIKHGLANTCAIHSTYTSLLHPAKWVTENGKPLEVLKEKYSVSIPDIEITSLPTDIFMVAAVTNSWFQNEPVQHSNIGKCSLLTDFSNSSKYKKLEINLKECDISSNRSVNNFVSIWHRLGAFTVAMGNSNDTTVYIIQGPNLLPEADSLLASDVGDMYSFSVEYIPYDKSVISSELSASGEILRVDSGIGETCDNEVRQKQSKSLTHSGAKRLGGIILNLSCEISSLMITVDNNLTNWLMYSPNFQHESSKLANSMSLPVPGSENQNISDIFVKYSSSFIKYEQYIENLSFNIRMKPHTILVNLYDKIEIKTPTLLLKSTRVWDKSTLKVYSSAYDDTMEKGDVPVCKSLPWNLEISDIIIRTLDDDDLHPKTIFNASLSVTISLSHKILDHNIEHGVCVHVELQPCAINIQRNQLNTLYLTMNTTSNVALHFYNSFLLFINKDQLVKSNVTTLTVPSVAASLKDMDSASSTGVVAGSPIEYETNEEDNIYVTLWMQFTFPKVSINLDKEAIALHVDEISCSLDVAPTYAQLKFKLGSFFLSDDSISGKFNDPPARIIIACPTTYNSLNIPTQAKTQVSSCLSITYTKALSKTVQHKFGDDTHSFSKYTSEICLNMQPLDVIAWMPTVSVIINMFNMSDLIISSKTTNEHQPVSNSLPFWLTDSLPLIHCQLSQCRLILPRSLIPSERNDCIVFQLMELTVSSNCDNELSRVVIRSDIYKRLTWLHERQFEMQLINASLSTVTLNELLTPLSLACHQNPAVEWNKLGMPPKSYLGIEYILKPINVRALLAPALFSKSVACNLTNFTAITGHAFEFHIATDINMYINEGHLNLFSDILERNIGKISLSSFAMGSDHVVPKYITKTSLSLSNKYLSGGVSHIQPMSKQIHRNYLNIPIDALLTIPSIILNIEFFSASPIAVKIIQPYASFRRTKKDQILDASLYELCIEIDGSKFLDTGMGKTNSRTSISQALLTISYGVTSDSATLITDFKRPIMLALSHNTISKLIGTWNAAYKLLLDTCNNIKKSSHPITKNESTIIDSYNSNSNNYIVLDDLMQTVENSMMATLVHEENVNELQHCKNVTIVMGDWLSLITSHLTSLVLDTDQLVVRYFNEDSSLGIQASLSSSHIDFLYHKLVLKIDCNCNDILIQTITPHRIFPVIGPTSCFVMINAEWLYAHSLTVYQNNIPTVILDISLNSIPITLAQHNLNSMLLLQNEIMNLGDQFMGNSNPSHDIHIVEESSQTMPQEKSFDDLRSGLLQYRSGGGWPEEDTVLFSDSTLSLCYATWRYKNPRALTSCIAHPVPFNTSLKVFAGTTIECSLLYYDKLQDDFVHYSSFELSESTYTRVILPCKGDMLIVSPVWRVVAHIDEDNHLITSNVLAAALQVDSCYSPNSIAALSLSLKIDDICCSILASPDVIKLQRQDLYIKYTFNLLNVDDYEIIQSHINSISTTANVWFTTAGSVALAEIRSSGGLTIDIVEQNSMSLQPFIRSIYDKYVLVDSTINLARNRLQKDNNLKCNAAFYVSPMQLYFTRDTIICLNAIFAHPYCLHEYIIFNDLNDTITVGQYNTHQKVQIKSQHANPFSWMKREKAPKLIIHINNYECHPIELGDGDSLPLMSNYDTIIGMCEIISRGGIKHVEVRGGLCFSNSLNMTIHVELCTEEESDSITKRKMEISVSPFTKNYGLLNVDWKSIRISVDTGTPTQNWSNDIPLEKDDNFALFSLPDCNFQCLYTQTRNSVGCIQLSIYPFLSLVNFLPCNLLFHLEEQDTFIAEYKVDGKSHISMLYHMFVDKYYTVSMKLEGIENKLITVFKDKHFKLPEAETVSKDKLVDEYNNIHPFTKEYSGITPTNKWLGKFTVSVNEKPLSFSNGVKWELRPPLIVYNRSLYHDFILCSHHDGSSCTVNNNEAICIGDDISIVTISIRNINDDTASGNLTTSLGIIEIDKMFTSTLESQMVCLQSALQYHDHNVLVSVAIRCYTSSMQKCISLYDAIVINNNTTYNFKVAVVATVDEQEWVYDIGDAALIDLIAKSTLSVPYIFTKSVKQLCKITTAPLLLCINQQITVKIGEKSRQLVHISGTQQPIWLYHMLHDGVHYVNLDYSSQHAPLMLYHNCTPYYISIKHADANSSMISSLATIDPDSTIYYQCQSNLQFNEPELSGSLQFAASEDDKDRIALEWSRNVEIDMSQDQCSTYGISMPNYDIVFLNILTKGTLTHIYLSLEPSGVPPESEEMAVEFLFGLEEVSISLDNQISLSLDQLSLRKSPSNISLNIGNFQVDNSSYRTGQYDFPVIVSTQIKNEATDHSNFRKWILSHDPLLSVGSTAINIDADLYSATYGRNLVAKVCPLKFYIEDIYIREISTLFNVIKGELETPKEAASLSLRLLPKYIEDKMKSKSTLVPFERIIIDDINLQVSLHVSIKMYLAVHDSPIYFTRFNTLSANQNLEDLSTQLGMHYGSGLIFKAGMVIGSLELLGSPVPFVRYIMAGLFDLFSLPYNNLTGGPLGIISGVASGTSSFVKNMSAGALVSLVNLTSSIARNLDRLSMDERHTRWQEENRRHRTDSVGGSVAQSLTGFGLSLLSGVAGIADQPINTLTHQPADVTKAAILGGLLTGVGKGAVGVVVKPIGGVAELMSQTGRGILYGTGLGNTPNPRRHASPHNDDTYVVYTDSKYIVMLQTPSIEYVVHNVTLTQSPGFYDVVVTKEFLYIISTTDFITEPRRMAITQLIWTVEDKADEDDVVIVRLFDASLADKQNVPATDVGDRIEEFVRTAKAMLNTDSELAAEPTSGSNLLCELELNRRESNRLDSLIKRLQNQSFGYTFPV